MTSGRKRSMSPQPMGTPFSHNVTDRGVPSRLAAHPVKLIDIARPSSRWLSLFEISNMTSPDRTGESGIHRMVVPKAPLGARDSIGEIITHRRVAVPKCADNSIGANAGRPVSAGHPRYRQSARSHEHKVEPQVIIIKRWQSKYRRTRNLRKDCEDLVKIIIKHNYRAARRVLEGVSDQID
jgi:hypothetical protein